MLREYQQRTIDRLREQYAAGHRSVACVLPTGAGKTVCAAEMIRLSVARGNRVLFLVHRQELLSQSVSKLESAGITDLRIIQAGSDLGSPRAPVAVASIPTLTRWTERQPEAQFVIVDECFPAGTLVDNRPIESLRIGDLVRSFNHETQRVEMRAIRQLFVSRPQSLVTIYLTDGRAITCTAGHPFFDGSNYTAAVHLKRGDAVYGASVHVRGVLDDVRTQSMDEGAIRIARVWRSVQEGSSSQTIQEGRNHLRSVLSPDCAVWAQWVSGGQTRTRLLLGSVQGGMDIAREFYAHGSYESEACERTDEEAQSNAQRSDSRSSVGLASLDGARASDSWRQRNRAIADGSTALVSTAQRMDSEFGRTDTHGARQWLSKSLQDRHCSPDSKDRGGGRWSKSLCDFASRTGCEETSLARVARVDRVEIHKRTGADGFRPLCPDNLVYNIEVDGNHNYFVDGVLVHNCHHVVAKTWRRLADHYSSSLTLGLTATPQRADSRALGDIFDSLVVGATVRELTDLGHLVPCRVYAPPQTLEAKHVAQSPLEAYQRLTPGQRAVIFCITVEHARRVADEMNTAGVRTAVVHGEMGKDARRTALADLDAGRISAVASIGVLTEGWDSPGVSVCILARKPQHTGLYLQMVGRVLRPAPGKTHATLIDLCGSVHDHGPPDMDREYSLEGKGIGKVDRELIRQCVSCGVVFRVGPSACPVCNVEMPRRTIELPTALGTELVDIETLPRLKPRAVTLSITAKFPGTCKSCGGRIAIGQQVYWIKGEGAKHTNCQEARGAA